jgi:tRNA (adenine22-N1)-methyltransferase
MNLSNRLEKIANFVPKNTIVADIGCDHGYIPIYLIKNNISKKIIAIDISENSIRKTIENVKINNLEKDIDIRVGDGLDKILSYEVDTVIIAGMGGLMIRDILDKDKKKTNSITNFILQANIASKELRKYLYENNFEIIDEGLVKEGDKFYEIIHARRGKDFVTKDIYYEIGEKLIINKNPLLKEYINYKIKVIGGILFELEGVKTEKAINRKKELNKNLMDLKEVLLEIEGS